MQIFINSQWFTDKLLNQDFNVVHRAREYSGEFVFLVHKSLLPKIKVSMEIRVFNADELIFGGLINELELKRLDENMFIVRAICGEYTITASRRTITSIIDTEPDGEDEGDRNTTGALVERYFNNILSEERIEKGSIVRGGRIAESDLEEFDTMSINDIYNALADITGDDWHIGYDAKLYFGDSQYIGVNHTEPERELNETNVTGEKWAGFFDLEVRQVLTDYKNKVFIIGGDPDEDVPEENIDLDGNLKYFKELPLEQQYMGQLNGDSGVWGYVIRDENIHTLEDAESRATKELEKNGKLPVEIKVSTFMKHFKPTDTVFVNLPSWDINNQIFSVEEVELTTIGDRIAYTLTLVNRINVEARAENFTKFMEKLVKEAKKRTIIKGNSNNNGGEGGGGDIPEFNLPNEWRNIPLEEILYNSVVFDPGIEDMAIGNDNSKASMGNDIERINYLHKGILSPYYSYPELFDVGNTVSIKPKLRLIDKDKAISFEHGNFITQVDRDPYYKQEVAVLQKEYGVPSGQLSFAVIKDMSGKFSARVYRGYGSEFPDSHLTNTLLKNNKVTKHREDYSGQVKTYIYDGRLYKNEEIEEVQKSNKPLSIVGTHGSQLLPTYLGYTGDEAFECIDDWDGLYGCTEHPRCNMGNNMALLHSIVIPHSYTRELGAILEGPEEDGGVEMEAYIAYKVLHYLHQRFNIASNLPILSSPGLLNNWWHGYL